MSQTVEPNVSPSKARLSFLWVGLGAAVALTVGLLLTFAALSSMQDDLLSRDRVRRMEAIRQALTSSIDQASRFALAQAQTLAADTAIAKAMGEQDRARLNELTRSIFQNLKLHGIAVLGFATPDLKYFFRAHQPELFGDDQSKTRPILLAVNKGRQAQSGVESGLSGALARGVAPVLSDGQFVGTLEVGLNLDTVISQVKAITNADVAIIFSQTMTGLGPKDSREAFGDLLLTSSTDSRLFSALLRDDTIKLTRDTTLSDQQIDGVDSAILVQPLIDFSGRMIGVLAAVRGFSAHNIERQQTRIELLAYSLIAGIVAFAVFSVLAKLALMREEQA